MTLLRTHSHEPNLVVSGEATLLEQKHRDTETKLDLHAKLGSTGQYIVEPGGTINGYRGIVSNQATTGNLYFGNFSDLLIGMFGGLDIVVDPYTNSTSGTIRIVALQSVDVAVRHAVSFAYGNDGV